ncbi:MAG: FHA domain-containing protein [Acidobacteriota bacterium]|nr:FHA domain-containing protein [Acidobacteriota bacterium]
MTPEIAPVTPKEIIDLILEEMRAEIAPLYFTNLVRSVYDVYLSAEDLERLRPVRQRIREEAVRALNDELSRLNRSRQTRINLPLLKDTSKKARYEAMGEWVVEFHENTDDDAKENPLIVHSAFALPQAEENRAGTLTERITKKQVDGRLSTTHRAGGVSETSRAGGVIFANIDYEDDSGRQTYPMAKETIKIGRGAADRWVDLKLNAKKDVSREHVQIRRDLATGRFFIKDLSTLGTTVNGKRIAPSIQHEDGRELDRNIETRLPEKARIGLADVVFLDFRAVKTNG